MRANTLGAGFLDKVYENALAHALTKAGLLVRQQIAIGVEYDGVTVDAYGAGRLVENAVLVEIKAVRALDTNHDAQCLNSSSGDRPYVVLADEFRQVSPGDQVPGHGPYGS
jgi:GxxExxY protein